MKLEDKEKIKKLLETTNMTNKEIAYKLHVPTHYVERVKIEISPYMQSLNKKKIEKKV